MPEAVVAPRFVGGLGDCGEGDLEGFRVNHAQVRERGLHLVGGGLRQAVRALASGRVSVRMCFLGGVGNDGGHDLLQVMLGGSRAVGGVGAPRRPACFQAVHRILSVIVFDE
jgi:hypothetical protein